MLKRIAAVLCLCLLVPFTIYAEDDYVQEIAGLEDPSYSLSTLHGEPSAMAFNCVNVISGEYSDYSQDLVIPGVEPLTLERFYSSNDIHAETPFRAWKFNHDISLLHTLLEYAPVLKDAFGASLKFKFDRKINEKWDLYKPCKDVLQKRVIHKPKIMSGRSHLQNLGIEAVDHDRFRMKDGSGNQSFFGYLKFKEDSETPIQSVLKPNGKFLSYAYYSERPARPCVIGLFHTNVKNFPDNKVKFGEDDQKIPISRFEFRYEKIGVPCHIKYSDVVSRYEPNSCKKIRVYGNGNQELSLLYFKRTYYYVGYKQGREGYRHKSVWLLKECHKNGLLEQNYVYERTTHKHIELPPKIIKKELPDGRFLGIDYYKKGHNMVWPGMNEDKWECRGRVMRLNAPVGTDETPVPIGKFLYFLNKNKKNKLTFSGYTHVYDADHHLKVYHFEKDERLSSIQSFTGTYDHKLYCDEKLFWNRQNGNLIGKVLVDAHNTPLFCCRYVYDSNGNLNGESIWGNLTGKLPAQLVVNDAGEPIANGCESFSVGHEHTKDGLNLISYENSSTANHDIKYRYYKGTNLLAARYILSNKIHKREFFKYDDRGAVRLHVIDDGCSLEKTDLTGVTERHVKRIQNTTSFPVGLPHIIEEKYLDVATRQERLLHKTVKHYNAEGRVAKEDHYDSNGTYVYSLEWEYNKKGQVIREVDAMGQSIVRSYDDNGNLLSEVGPGPQRHLSYSYDFMNRLIKEEERDDQGRILAKSHKYNFVNNRVSTIDPYGNETNFSYDEFGRVIQITYPPVMNEEGVAIRPTVQKTYDALGNATSVTDQLGRTTHAHYTLYKKPYLIQYPDGTEERCEYSLKGQLLKSIDRDKNWIEYEYDDLGRATRKRLYNKDGECVGDSSRIYNTFHLLEEKDLNGQVTRYTYDGAGRIATIVKGEECTEFHYDSLGRQHKICKYTSHNEYFITEQTYDFLNRVISLEVRDQSGQLFTKEEYVYDPMGHCILKKSYNQAGQAIEVAHYDPLGRVIKKEDALKQAIYCSYDFDQPRSEITDPMGNKIIQVNDALGRIVSLTCLNSYGLTTKQADFYYDAANNKAKSVETVYVCNEPIREVITRWSYDSMNKLKAIHDAIGTPEESHTGYEYDSKGRLKKLIKQDGIEIAYEHDARGRLIAYSSSDGTIDYRYSYEVHEHPILIDDKVTGKSTKRSYNANLHLVGEELANGLKMAYVHDRLGRISHMNLPDNSRFTYIYNGIHLKEIQRFSPAGELMYYQINEDYDLSGNLVKAVLPGQCGELYVKKDVLNRSLSRTSKGRKERCLAYDSMNHLLSIEVEDPLGSYVNNYTYDDLYQLSSEEGAFSHTYVNDSLYNHYKKDDVIQEFNSLNQLLTDVDTNYTYDKNGNLSRQIKKDSSINYVYDALGRLAEVQEEGRLVRYSYDAFNRRLSKEVCQNERLVEAVDFLYRGLNEIGAFDKNHQALELRVPGGDESQQGAAIAIELGKHIYVPVYDHKGNVTALLDLDGNLVESYRYNAFGDEEIYDDAGELLERSLNPWRFAGKRKDEETGFIYFGARYYNPKTACWITPDPLNREGGPNLYAYVLHDPMALCDLYGYYAEGIDGGYSWVDHKEFDLEFDFRIARDYFSKLTFDCRGFENFFSDKSSNFILENRTFSLNHGYSFINGICTDLKLSQKHATYFSDLTGGFNVRGTHNMTHSFFVDFGIECPMGLMGLATEPAFLLLQNWIEAFDGKDASYRHFHACHSQGAIHTYNALCLAPKEIRDRLYICNVEGAVLIPKDICHYAVNIVNESILRDLVPHFRLNDRIKIYILGKMFGPIYDSYLENCYNIIKVKSHPEANLFDHDFNSKSYRPYIQAEIKKFREATK